MVNKLLGLVKHIVFEKGKIINYLALSRRNAYEKNLIKSNTDINVGIMFQDPTTWETIKAVYFEMKSRPNMNVKIVVVPQVEFAYYVKLVDVQYSKIYSIAKELAPDDIVLSYNEKLDSWIDISTLGFDYVFYMSPYETYLPKCLRASNVSKYSRVCYVPYANALLNDYYITYNSHFIRNAYNVFCEKNSAYEYVNKQFGCLIKRNLVVPFNIGYPRYDLLSGYMPNECELWKNPHDDRFRIIWTPRWTSSARLGGSNFLNYKDSILKYVEEQDNIDLVFRPHPMTFEHYVSVGLISKEELEEYCNIYTKSNCSTLDLGRTYFDTFFSSDVLVTDISSIIWDYMFTGKPVIFCPSSRESYGVVKELAECMYWVETFDDIKKLINDIRNGIDPLKEKRNLLAESIKRDGHIAQNIVDVIEKQMEELS